MKKSIVFSMLALFSLYGETIYADHQANQPETTTVSASAPSAVEVKSPWSAVYFLETERVATGKPQQAFSNLMYLEVGRTLLENTVPGLKLALRLYGSNNFSVDQEKEGLDRYFTFYEPTLLLTKGNLFEIAGISATAQTRFYAPLNADARLDNRNPHWGNWRKMITFERTFGKWALGNSNFVQYYSFKNAVNPLSERANDHYRLYNDVTASYQITDSVRWNTAFEFEHRWKRVTGVTSSLLEWVNTVAFSPVRNLDVEAGVILSAPEQTLRKYFQEHQSRLENTRARLDLSYKFL